MNYANGICTVILRFFKINGSAKVPCLKTMIIVLRSSKVTVKTRVTCSRISRDLLNQLYFTISVKTHTMTGSPTQSKPLTPWSGNVAKIDLARKSSKSFISEVQFSKVLMFFDTHGFRLLGLARLTIFNVSQQFCDGFWWRTVIGSYSLCLYERVCVKTNLIPYYK